MFRQMFSLIFWLGLWIGPAQAHEVWLEPAQWWMEDKAEIKADLLNGENLKGVKLSWNAARTRRAELWQGNDKTPINGRLGDVPAITALPGDTGLATLIYQSDISTITYTDYAKFAGFVLEKGEADVLAEHAARRLPDAPIKEAYSRFVKALVAIGTGAGQDAPRGLEIEIVALSNPYTLTPDEDMQVQVLYRDAPLTNHRVTVFMRAETGDVTSFHLPTDAEGKASFTIVPAQTYLVDAVVVREPDRDVVIETRGALWESLWASLTFQTPAAP